MGTELSISSSVSWRSKEIIQNFIQPNLQRIVTAQPLCAVCSTTQLSPRRFSLHPSSDSAVLHVVTMQHCQGPGCTLITSTLVPRGLLLGPHKDLTSPNKPLPSVWFFFLKGQMLQSFSYYCYQWLRTEPVPHILVSL